MFHFISAGAGCGKTTFIINKIKNLAVDAKILVITYTNSCVEEINFRLKQEKNVTVCTFHSLCHQFVKSNKIFTESNNLPILSAYINVNLSSEFENFYNYFLSHSPFKEALYELQLQKVFPGEAMDNPPHNLNDFFRKDGVMRSKMPPHITDPEEWSRAYSKVKGHFNYLNRKYNSIYVNYFKEIEAAREELNLYTFHHMVLEIIDNITEFVMYMWETYDHIFIDEVQDLSHVQFNIIYALAEELVFLPEKSITVVGDINQSIFSFQGANRYNFEEFIEKVRTIPHINYRQDILNETHRFGGEILNFVNEKFFMHRSNIDYGKIHINEPYTNYKLLMAEVSNLISTLPKNEKIMILFQKRSSKINDLQSYLERELNITIQVHRKIFQQNALLEDFFHLVEFIITKQNIYLIKFLLGKIICIPEPEFLHFCQGFQKEESNFYTYFYDNYKHLQEVKDLSNMIHTFYLQDFLPVFFKSSLYNNFLNVYGEEAYLFLQEIAKLKDNVLHLHNLLQLKNQDLWFQQKGDIIFSTIHNAKGSEADHVIIIDGNEGPTSSSLFLKNNYPLYNFFKTNKNHDNREEFKHLLYVAVTRAKKHLYIYARGKYVNEHSIYGMCKWKNNMI